MMDLHVHSNFSDGSSYPDEIIQRALELGLKKIAITDHITPYGEFVHPRFTDYKKRTNNIITRQHNLDNYIKTLLGLRLQYSGMIDVLIGAEISTEFFPDEHFARNSLIARRIRNFDFFLIEGINLMDPISTSIDFKEELVKLGDKEGKIPIAIAHPKFEDFDEEDFLLLIDNKIGIEFNSSRFTEIDKSSFLTIFENLSSNQKKKLKIFVGSDAHNLNKVGSVRQIYKFINRNHLNQNVIDNFV